MCAFVWSWFCNNFHFAEKKRTVYFILVVCLLLCMCLCSTDVFSSRCHAVIVAFPAHNYVFLYPIMGLFC